MGCQSRKRKSFQRRGKQTRTTSWYSFILLHVPRSSLDVYHSNYSGSSICSLPPMGTQSIGFPKLVPSWPPTNLQLIWKILRIVRCTSCNYHRVRTIIRNWCDSTKTRTWKLTSWPEREAGYWYNRRSCPLQQKAMRWTRTFVPSGTTTFNWRKIAIEKNQDTSSRWKWQRGSAVTVRKLPEPWAYCLLRPILKAHSLYARIPQEHSTSSGLGFTQLWDCSP